MTTNVSRLLPLTFGVMAACFPSTTRPTFLPEPSAAVTEVELGVPEATRALALALHDDSIPVRRTEAKDGWLESEWFDARTGQPTKARQLGPDVVKVRAWINPARPSYRTDNHSILIVETVYRPLADPSRADRELERQVPATHPMTSRMLQVELRLAKMYGGAPADTVIQVKPASSGKASQLKPAGSGKGSR
jgi:hypothetical protein